MCMGEGGGGGEGAAPKWLSPTLGQKSFEMKPDGSRECNRQRLKGLISPLRG